MEDRFERTFTPPLTEADLKHVGATFKKGVLEVHVPKLEQATPRKIDIEAAAEPAGERVSGSCRAGHAPGKGRSWPQRGIRSSRCRAGPRRRILGQRRSITKIEKSWRHGIWSLCPETTSATSRRSFWSTVSRAFPSSGAARRPRRRLGGGHRREEAGPDPQDRPSPALGGRQVDEKKLAARHRGRRDDVAGRDDQGPAQRCRRRTPDDRRGNQGSPSLTQTVRSSGS